MMKMLILKQAIGADDLNYTKIYNYLEKFLQLPIILHTARYAGINAGGDDKFHGKKLSGDRQRNQNQTKILKIKGLVSFEYRADVK